ncbi:heme peroxidase [Xylogone sp. PMI_703]|nr:heme peroxidase [Xylogone sp. PMI_703]
MLLPILLTIFSLLRGLNAEAVDANGITLSEKIIALQRQMLNPTTLFFLVTPCSVNFNDNPNRGEQTSAEWVRIVFHDSITANAAGPGLGGLDASIGFESDRPENVGIFVNVTLGQFSQFSSVFLSMSDLIGIGLSDALAACDPTARRIPLRVGRIDATGPGPAGVPKPTDSFEFALDAFATAGFNQSEMIQAVACGHSLGGVHHTNFPDIGWSFTPGLLYHMSLTCSLIVPDLQDPTNTDGRASFDSTPAVFDNTGVNEYLDGTGLKGGPLVVGPDATNSDLRIFSSDNNVTISEMSSPQSFEDTCFTIFEKMLNTVPSAVTLSDPIVFSPWIISVDQLDLDSAGVVSFSGTITGHSSSPLPDTASYVYQTASGGNTGTKTSQEGVAFPVFQNTPLGFGTISTYAFSDTIDPSVTSINVENTFTEAINQNLFVIFSQSFRNPLFDPNSGAVVKKQYVIRAAILSKLAPAGTVLSVKLWWPATQPGTVVPKIDNTSTSMTFKSTIGSYSVFEAVLAVGDGVNVLPSGSSTILVTLGTTQASAKVDPDTWSICTNNDLTTC